MVRNRVLRLVSPVLIGAMLLTGCSTGSAPEAHRAQESDAQETSVISNMQATYTWELINGSPEATPTETPTP